MPGFDGTGPRGSGPMTGGGGGFCVLKLPRAPDEPATGFAGLSGRPVRCFVGRAGVDVASLRSQAQRLGMMVARIRRRLRAFETLAAATPEASKAKGTAGPRP